MTDEVVTWLRAQVDWQEGIARRAKEADDQADRLFEGHCSPSWTLREITVKRRMLEIHQPVQDGFTWTGPVDDPNSVRIPVFYCSTCCDPGTDDIDNGPSTLPWPCDTIRLQTVPYQDRPGFRAEWLPDVDAES